MIAEREVTLPERVKSARRSAELTRKELADRLGVSLWRIETLEEGGGDWTPSAEELARATGKSASWFAAVVQEPAKRPRRLMRAFPRRPLDENGSPGGQEIALVRREAGMSQRELASSLGVPLYTVERLEAGSLDPLFYVEDIARATGQPAEWAGRPALAREVTQENWGSGDDGARGQSLDWRVAQRRGLVLATLALLTLIRFVTEVVPILPQALNFIDIPLLAILVVAAAQAPVKPRDAGEAARYAPAALIFLVLCVAATMANPSRVEAGPVLVFIYGFLGPLIVYWAVYRLWEPGAALALSRLLIVLLFIQFAVVAFIDLPRFLSTDNPDEISGTFGENPYQLVFFLLVMAAVLAGIFTFEHRRAVARFAPALFLGILGVILLAQYRSLLFTTALTIIVVTLVLGSARARGLVAGAVAAVAFVFALSYTSQAFPILDFAPVVSTFKSDPTSYVTERAHALSHFARLYGDEPRYIASGTGPGTYSSRGWQTFSQANSTSPSNVQGAYAKLLTGGTAYSTDVSRKYVEPQFHEAESVEGSKALGAPFSSYGSLLAEVGLLGFLVMVGVWVRAFVQAIRMTLITRVRAGAGDPLPALVFGAAMAIFVLLQMAFLENWLEVARVTFPTWIFLAVATREFHARYQETRV